ncbi:MAG: alpha/beta fold hydrolase, partial [Burkholderiaceae bacterium]
MLDRTTTASTSVSGSARLWTYATPDNGKTPIVFLHASVCDSRMWHHEIATLGPTRRIAAFDRRGFGETKAVHEAFANVDDTIA